MDFSALDNDPVLKSQFTADIKKAVAEQSSLPIARVIIVSVTAGSVKVAADVTMPTKGAINTLCVANIAKMIAATDPSVVLGSDFVTKYALAGTNVVCSAPPPRGVVARNQQQECDWCRV